MSLKYKLSITLTTFILISGCREALVPKPRGYFRIDLPAKEYVRLDNSAINDMPFDFEYPSYGEIVRSSVSHEEQGWLNIEFPVFKAIVYLTYKPVQSDFASIMEQTYRMNVRNHISKADAIKEQPYINNKDRVYAVLYDLKGNTATAVQFYATDSLRHYLRGSLYFNAETDADSLAPVIDFLREDIIHLVETLNWK